MNQDEAWLFGDGACKGNPGPGGYGSILLINERVIELGGREELTTNNVMELSALFFGLQRLASEGLKTKALLKIFFDSKYVLSGAKAWRFGWSRKNWLTSEGAEVKNRYLWKDLHDLMSSFPKTLKIEYFYVPGHTGIVGNERVDQIASDFAEEKFPILFDGSVKEYDCDLSLGLERAETFVLHNHHSKSPSDNSKAAAYYLSLVGGQVYRDSTWSQCEARVKWVAGAKYKKIKSPKEEKETLAKWGF